MTPPEFQAVQFAARAPFCMLPKETTDWPSGPEHWALVFNWARALVRPQAGHEGALGRPELLRRLGGALGLGCGSAGWCTKRSGLGQRWQGPARLWGRTPRPPCWSTTGGALPRRPAGLEPARASNHGASRPRASGRGTWPRTSGRRSGATVARPQAAWGHCRQTQMGATSPRNVYGRRGNWQAPALSSPASGTN